jgi:hypothetical protein
MDLSGVLYKSHSTDSEAYFRPLALTNEVTEDILQGSVVLPIIVYNSIQETEEYGWMGLWSFLLV